MKDSTRLRHVLACGLAAVMVFLSSNARGGFQTASPPASAHKVIACYFHTNTRCSTCRKMEEYSQKAIKEGFPGELKNGSLELRIINYEKPEHRHFIQEYKLVTKSLILADFENGKQTRWANLKLVWQLYRNEKAFFNYVRQETREYLSGS